MVEGLIGRKIGMTQLFEEDGRVIPVTVMTVEKVAVRAVEKVAVRAAVRAVEKVAVRSRT